jgi:hypothetical protein
MLTVIPRYFEMLDSPKHRTLIQIETLTREKMMPDAFKFSRVKIKSPLQSPAQLIATRLLLDLLIRLDPLVRAVTLEIPPGREPEVLVDLNERFPIEISLSDIRSDFTVGIGVEADWWSDASGWSVFFRRPAENKTDRNPIGPQASACFAAGEVFKELLKRNFPNLPLTRQFVQIPSSQYSLFTYKENGPNPPITPLAINATIVGAGGIAAGIMAAFGELGLSLTGILRLIDGDLIDKTNFNRLIFARWADLSPAIHKVTSAQRYLQKRVPSVDIVSQPVPYGEFKENLGPRRERRIPLIVTAVDNDDTREEVQRDLPYELLDGGTGTKGNCRIERILFLDGACIGCRPRLQIEKKEGNCGELSDSPAPSISFLPVFTGIVLAGEIIKTALFPDYKLRGYMDHIFLYPPNSEMQGVSAKEMRCRVGCQQQSWIEAYRSKYTLHL